MATPSLAAAVADEIAAAGGEAVSSDADVATMDGAASVLADATEAFGDVHVVVNNAGILRDRMFVNMTEDDWDAVIRGHLKSTFCMTRQRGRLLARPVEVRRHGERGGGQRLVDFRAARPGRPEQLRRGEGRASRR